MTDSICFDRTLFVLLILIIAGLAIYNFFNYQKEIEGLQARLNNCSSLCSYPVSISNTSKDNKMNNYNNYNDNNNNHNNNNNDNNDYNNKHDVKQINKKTLILPNIPQIVEDPVSVYDVNNINNPLVYPTSRPPSYLFRPMINNPLFFYPTRGIPDKPSYIANLIEIKPSSENTDNYNPQLPSVLQLMGQQKYPGSSKFDYYVLLPSTGNNPPIKYPVNTYKNEEVYDGDIIEVLNKKYTVKKNKNFIS